jgi:hypothetical protein
MADGRVVFTTEDEEHTEGVLVLRHRREIPADGQRGGFAAGRTGSSPRLAVSAASSSRTVKPKLAEIRAPSGYDLALPD